ncbi:MAG: hypothetical protein EOP45_05530 [Sphingobacteriaceae bacterium]|nr:MAG: hypothetical protein EOP45_05530 [Sphingobacteriaceae bacterium]
MTIRNILYTVLISWTILGCKKNNSSPGTTDELKPAITFISPLADSLGKQVIISGKNFKAKPSVTFNGVLSVVEWSDDKEIQVKVPQNATSGKITVISEGTTIIYPVDFTVKSDPRQFYTDSEGGIIGGRILVNLLGSSINFTNPVIKFNGILAETYQPFYGGVVAIVPVGATSGDVTLTVNGKTYTNKNFKVVSGTFTTYSPSSITNIRYDPSGNLYGIVDNKVIKVNTAGVQNTIATIGNSNTYIGGCAVDKAGNVYVSAPFDKDPVPPSRYHQATPVYSTDDLKIYKITQTNVVSVFAGNSKMGHIDGNGTLAQFNYPTNLSFDNSGNLVVSDGSLVRKVSPAGVVSTFAGNDNQTQNFNDGIGTAASFNVLGASTSDDAGNIFIIDQDIKLRKITPAGQVTTIPYTPAEGTPFGAPFINDLAFHPSGDLYINANGAIYVMRKNDLSSSTGVIYNTYLNPLIKLGDSNGIAIDNSGNIYLSGTDDYLKTRIVKVVH